MTTARRTRGRGPTRPWLVAGLGSAALAIVFGVLLVLDLTGPTPGRLQLPRVPGATAAVVSGPVSGTWTVAPGSQVGYRVHEILFGLDHTAVGRTPQVSGGMTISGTDVVAADFTVQMATVESDQAGRNVMWQDYIMHTGAHPQAHFRLTRAIDLGSVPPVGQVVTVPATGQLTMRGVTRTIRFAMHGERASARAIDLDAEIPITFAEWQIPNPSFEVAKVGRTGTLEVLLRLTQAVRAS